MKKNNKPNNSFIEILRKELGKTPVEFYELLGMSRFLYYYYKSANHGISQETVKRLLKACDGLLTEKQKNKVLAEFYGF